MNKKLILFHFICFSTVVLGVSGFLFYQVFVDQSSRKIPLSQFLQPTTFLSALRSLPAKQIPINIDGLYSVKETSLLDEDGQVLAEIIPEAQKGVYKIGSKKYLTQLNLNILSITDLDTKHKYTLDLGNDGQFEVLGWQDQNQVILSKKSVQYSIVKIDLNTLKVSSIIDNIDYNGKSIQSNYLAKITLLTYPECSPQCYFKVFDVVKNEMMEELPAFTEPSHAASLRNVRLLFFDAEKGLVGYEVPESRELYLIDRKLNFLQYVRLENDRNSIHFLSYIPETQQLVFSLEERESNKQTIALVSANTPSLHVLTQTDLFYPVIISPLAKIYQWGDTFFDLNGKEIKQPVDGSLVPTF